MAIFVEFNSVYGKKLFINVDAITDIYENEAGSCRVDLVSGPDECFYVRGSYDQVTSIVHEALN